MGQGHNGPGGPGENAMDANAITKRQGIEIEIQIDPTPNMHDEAYGWELRTVRGAFENMEAAIRWLLTLNAQPLFETLRVL